MALKITVGLVHMLMIMEILVLSCALHVSEFCIFCEKSTVVWKVVTDGYLKYTVTCLWLAPQQFSDSCNNYT